MSLYGFDEQRHVTTAGKVVYARKPRQFSGSDLVRVLLAVSKNSTGSYANWRAVFTIAHREAWALFREENPRQEAHAGEKFEQFLQAFDLVVDYLGGLLSNVPGAGVFLGVTMDLYRWVRQHFPVV